MYQEMTPDPTSEMKRLVLGTAQLGMRYGISNRTGKPDPATAASIIEAAWDAGIRAFDTAQVYGDSERVLGGGLSALGISDAAAVISKIHPEIDHLSRGAMRRALEATLSAVGVPALCGMMLHREEFLDLWNAGLGEILTGFARSGRVKQVGVSVYSPARAVQALETEGITIVQVPANIFDRRFEKAGIFDLAEERGKTVYVRSIFLQGLFFLTPDSLPGHLKAAAPPLATLAALSREAGLEILEICIGYIKNSLPRARLVFGAESPAQVRRNRDCWNTAWPDGLTEEIRRAFDGIDEMVLAPHLWGRGAA